MSYDGSLVFDTKIDQAGFKKGVDGLKGVASTSMKVVTGLIAGAVTAIAGIGVASIKVGSEFEAGMSRQLCSVG